MLLLRIILFVALISVSAFILDILTQQTNWLKLKFETNDYESTIQLALDANHHIFKQGSDEVQTSMKQYMSWYNKNDTNILNFKDINTLSDIYVSKLSKSLGDAAADEYIDVLLSKMTILSLNSRSKRRQFYSKYGRVDELLRETVDHPFIGDVDLIVPGVDDDFEQLGRLFESVSLQTVLPKHLIFVLNGDNIPVPRNCDVCNEEKIQTCREMKDCMHHIDARADVNADRDMNDDCIECSNCLDTCNFEDIESDSTYRLLSHVKGKVNFNVYIYNNYYVIRTLSGAGIIPLMTIVLRKGRYLPGDNRMFGLLQTFLKKSVLDDGSYKNINDLSEKYSNSSSNNKYIQQRKIYSIKSETGFENDVVTFFDCDDYMHPQRIEVIDRTFRMNLGLDALLHSFVVTHPNDVSAVMPFYRSIDLSSDINELSRNRLPYTYGQIRQSVKDVFPLAFQQKKLNGTLVTNPFEPTGWYFPNKLLPKIYPNCHQGWISLRKRTLLKVDYPQTTMSGEDGLFVFRIIKSGLNFMCVDIPIGAYIHAKDSLQVHDEFNQYLKKQENAMDNKEHQKIMRERKVGTPLNITKLLMNQNNPKHVSVTPLDPKKGIQLGSFIKKHMTERVSF